jgi:hypothetical protein
VLGAPHCQANGSVTGPQASSAGRWYVPFLLLGHEIRPPLKSHWLLDVRTHSSWDPHPEYPYTPLPEARRFRSLENDCRAYNGGIHVHQPNKCVWDVKDVCFYMLKTPRIAF